MKQVKIYMSHAIRGSKGPNATKADMQINNLAAMRAARVIRAWLYPLPVELYCPAEHDEFVMIAYRKGFLHEQNILVTDCEIVGRCDALIWYSRLGPSKGAEIEVSAARRSGILIFDLPLLDESHLSDLEEFVEELCQKS